MRTTTAGWHVRAALMSPVVTCVALVFYGAGGAFAATLEEEFRVKSEQVFEFVQKPKVTWDGDRVGIEFETKAFCDATVAIENAEGRIIRHLASGVLGPNAPAPFQKNSKKQSIVWDGKDGQGAYVDDKESVTVRVSLGLKAQFERHLLWSPHRRISNVGHAPTLYAAAPFASAPEGVYVFDGSQHDHLRLFDHDGNYLRTVYPFPREQLDKVRGVKMQVFPQSGQTLPFKDGNYRSTLLTSGTNREGGYLGQLFGLGALAMSVRGGRIALVCNRLNRLATDGTTGGLDLEGPVTRMDGPPVYGMTGPDAKFLPRSAALSPDGKTLYITGWNREAGNPNWTITWFQGVGRVDFEKGDKVEPFVGVLSPDAKNSGSGPGQFKSPVSVDTDPQGRVYVADAYNERIQIFDPSGKHLKSVPVPGGEESLPTEVAVNQRNGDIYVFSWYLDCRSFRKSAGRKRIAKLFHYGPFDNPELKAQYALPIPDQSRRGLYGGDQHQGREFRATIDPWAPDDKNPRVWLVPGYSKKGYTQLLVLRINTEKQTLEPVKDFNAQADRDLPENGYWGYGDRWLAVRHDTGEVYVDCAGGKVVVNPETGKASVVRPPMAAASGGLYFDWQGHAYLRDFRRVARFAISGSDAWREVPFDYGEEHGGLRGVIPIDCPSIHGQPGFSVSVHGHIVVGYIIGDIETLDRGKDAARQQAKAQWKPWTPTLFMGRGGNSIVRVWDKHGKGVYEDAVRGIGYIAGVFMGRDGDFYLASEAQRAGYFDFMTGTFVRFKPNGKILSNVAVLPLDTLPEGRPDTHRGAGHRGDYWWEGAEWFYGGMGYAGKNNASCHCPKFQAAHDYFDRSFVPETGHCSVAVLDSAGNLMLRIGRYGNVDDGIPLAADGPPVPNRRNIGGDEVGLFYPAYLATHSDRRLFIQDPGNQRVVSVKLGYHTTETVALKEVGGKK